MELCDAEMTTPASALYFLVRYAIAGVGITPMLITCAPTEQKPAVSPASSISPEMRVSLPTRIFGLSVACFVSTSAPALPSSNASSAVSSLLAIPLTPSVPNNLPIVLSSGYSVFLSSDSCAESSLLSLSAPPSPPFSVGSGRRTSVVLSTLSVTDTPSGSCDKSSRTSFWVSS